MDNGGSIRGLADRKIDEVTFCIFDTETTGLEPDSGDRIVEIAAVKIKAGEKVDVFETLVNPERDVSPAAFEVHRISPEELARAPKMIEAIPQFLDFIGDSCLASYNAPFDLEFLNHELKLAGRDAVGNREIIDILVMARKLLPNLERYALWFVAEKLKITGVQKHRALSDVEITIGVFRKLAESLRAKGIDSFGNVMSLCGVRSQMLEALHSERMAQIQEAISLGVKLKIRYFSASGAEVSEREVIPKEIKKEKNRSYLVGYCCLRQEERTFRVDGILHLEIV